MLAGPRAQGVIGLGIGSSRLAGLNELAPQARDDQVANVSSESGGQQPAIGSFEPHSPAQRAPSRARARRAWRARQGPRVVSVPHLNVTPPTRGNCIVRVAFPSGE
jgi:hypothetical protein